MLRGWGAHWLGYVFDKISLPPSLLGHADGIAVRGEVAPRPVAVARRFYLHWWFLSAG